MAPEDSAEISLPPDTGTGAQSPVPPLQGDDIPTRAGGVADMPESEPALAEMLQDDIEGRAGSHQEDEV